MNFTQFLILFLVVVIGKDLERWERELPLVFSTFLLSGAVIFSAFGRESPQPQSNIHVENLVQITDGSDRKGFIIRIVDGQKMKFNISFHRRLEKYFPDWDERITYQKKQEKFYNSAIKKRREALRLRSKENWNLTDQEQDAMDYFTGRGFYKEHQDLRKKPNIFDNRQSFLFKMLNKEMRDSFLRSYNRTENDE